MNKLRPRSEWQPLEDDGLCSLCQERRPCSESCPRLWFDRGVAVGYHDGANGMEYPDHAFVDLMIEDGVYDPD